MNKTSRSTMRKKARVIILPAIISNLAKKIIRTPKLVTADSIGANHGFIKQGIYEPQHLYVISDDKIKEGDWFYDSNKGKIHQCNTTFTNSVSDVSNNVTRYTHRVNERLLFKIIATTDKFLKLPLISQSFIKEYCETGNRDEIHVWYTSGTEFAKPIIDNGEIVIYPIPTKDTYTRKEVEVLLFKFLNREHFVLPNGEMGRQSLDDFIKENL